MKGHGSHSGYSLLELVTVASVLTILTGIGFTVFYKPVDDAERVVGQTNIKQLGDQCALNYATGLPLTSFDAYETRGYLVSAEFKDTCSGVIGLISQRPDVLPSFFYNASSGVYSCKYGDMPATPFPDCQKISGASSVAQADEDAVTDAPEEAEVALVEEPKPHSVEDLGQDEFCSQVPTNAPNEHAGKRVCAPDPHVLSENIFTYFEADYWYSRACIPFPVQKDSAYLATAKKLLADSSLQTCAEAHNQRTCASAQRVESMRNNCFPEYVDPRRLTEIEITQLEAEV